MKHTADNRLIEYVQAEQDKIYRLAYSYTQNEQDALDVAQTAITKALSAYRIREPLYLKTWVYRIVVNTAIDFLRARNRLVFSDSDGFADAEIRPQTDARLDLEEALGKLPADLKAIIVLRYFHELQLKEVANVLDMNLNTVKTKLYRALRTLKIEMEDNDA